LIIAVVRMDGNRATILLVLGRWLGLGGSSLSLVDARFSGHSVSRRAREMKATVAPSGGRHKANTQGGVAETWIRDKLSACSQLVRLSRLCGRMKRHGLKQARHSLSRLRRRTMVCSMVVVIV
jgi:hypothetical protein